MIECEFCGEIGHSNNQCVYDLWSHIVEMISNYSEFNEESFSFQKQFLECNVPHFMIIAIAVRFCNFTYTSSSSFDDIIQSIYNGLRLLYLDMANEEEISEILNESIDPDEIVQQHLQWTVEPIILCLETIEELKEEIFCSICLDNHTMLETVTTNCRHKFGKTCMCSHLDYQITNRCPTCPLCRAEVITLEIKDSDFYDELYERYVEAPLAFTSSNIVNDIDSITYIDLLDSFEFMQEGLF
jgi:hypothetical protein